MNFYHGTSDALSIKHTILPCATTLVKRENFRVKFTDKVFVTNSICSAEKYSKKACDKFGGAPVIYKVKPIAVECLNGCEYICEKAMVVSKV